MKITLNLVEKLENIICVFGTIISEIKKYESSRGPKN
jgi:hypothetical protein